MMNNINSRFGGFCFIAALVVLLAFSVNCPAQEQHSNQQSQSEDSLREPSFDSAVVEVHHETNIGEKLPLFTIIPFAGILLSIALFPLLAQKFWHHHYPKVSAFWALVFAIPFLIFYKGDAFYEILHIYLVDYFPFIILLWGLFTVAGGILIRGTLAGKPSTNTVLILIGTALASWMGTTGAAMLMIRPIIRANELRKYKVHTIIFFIFLVANIGGSLTPLGDPPLFLGFLHGVPFFWTFNIFPHMLFMVVCLIIIYFILDMILYRKEGELPKFEDKQPLKLEGIHNFLLIAGIPGAVLLSGKWRPGDIDVLGVHVQLQNLARDGLIILMGILSLITTSKITRRDNEFSWEPIREVAYLFAGIFMTIIPALAILRAGEHGALAFIIEAVQKPWHYFWVTGSLSAFLDNAPTYLTFFNTALGSLGLTEAQVTEILSGNSVSAVGEKFIPILKAISAGAVFFGAMTYIGNAPNFMVKAIAEESRIKMPSFFGYMLWSVGILGVLFVAVTFIFLV